MTPSALAILEKEFPDDTDVAYLALAPMLRAEVRETWQRHGGHDLTDEKTP